MNSEKQIPLQSVYTIFVEEPDDYYFHPRGVLFVDEQSNHTLFSRDVDYNFLIRVVRKFPYEELEKGLEFNGYQFEFKNLSQTMLDKFGSSPKVMPLVLNEIYKSAPRQFSFLERFFDNISVFPHFNS